MLTSSLSILPPTMVNIMLHKHTFFSQIPLVKPGHKQITLTFSTLLKTQFRFQKKEKRSKRSPDVLFYGLFQGFTYPVQTHFLENTLEMIGYRLTTYNQIDDFGQDKSWKMNKQAPRKRKSQIASAVEV